MSAPDHKRPVGLLIEDFLDEYLRPGADRVSARLALIRLAERAQAQALDHMAALRERHGIATAGLLSGGTLDQLAERIADAVLDTFDGWAFTAGGPSIRDALVKAMREQLTAGAMVERREA
jgi:hypothetical protein